MNYIEYLKIRIEEIKNKLIEEPENEELSEKLYNLKMELQEKEGYQTLEDLGVEY